MYYTCSCKVRSRTGHKGPEVCVCKGIALLFLQPRRWMGMGGQRHTPAALPPGKRPGTCHTGGRVDARASLDGCRESRPHWDSIPRLSSPHQVTMSTELSWPTILANCFNICNYSTHTS